MPRRVFFSRFVVTILASLCLLFMGWQGVSGLALAQSAEGPLEIRSVSVEGDGAFLAITGNRSLASSRYYSSLKLTHPNRFVIDIPDAVLATQDTVFHPKIDGIEKIELSESRGSFYNASRVTVYVSDFKTLNQMNVSVQDNALMVAMNSAPVLPQPAAQMTSAKSGVIPVPEGASLIEDIYFRDGQLVVRGASNAQLLVKNRLVLGDPGRLVVDLDRAVVADRTLLKPITVNNDNIRQIRVGQFDEQTVRLVIEAYSPEKIQLLYSGPDKSLLAIQSGAGTEFSTLPSNTTLGNLNTVTVDKENGDTIIRLSATTAIAHRIIKDTSKIMVEMENIAAAPGWIPYERSQFPQLDYIKLDSLTPGQPNSKLVIDLKSSDMEMASLLSPDGKTLEITLMNGRPFYGAYREFNRVPFAARVVVDAGHGGKDLGANREGLNEKDLNLSVALKLKQALEARGVKVYLTRSTDEFLPLPRITEITNSIHPDLFVSVHTNSSTNAGITGLETYYYTPQSVALARRVHGKLVNNIPSPDRGVRKAMFYVIHHTSVPSILCEMGYISNASERSLLFSEARKQKTAEAIAEGVVEYLKSSLSARAK